MRFEFCLVLAIVLTLNISTKKVQGYSNIGLVVQTLARLPSNESCDQNNRNCKYYMELCLKFGKDDKCSLLNRKSLTWIIKPGNSKRLRIGDDVIQYIENPLRFPLGTWKALPQINWNDEFVDLMHFWEEQFGTEKILIQQEVVLRANVRKTHQLDFAEKILIKERLPYPINDLKRLEENKIKKCSAHFCLTVSIYMWCDDIPRCAGACASKPCQNEGVCVNDGSGGYQCECTPNWEDKNCDMPKWCRAVSFSKRGCYSTPRPRLEPTVKLLFNRRDELKGDVWTDKWNKFIETVVCDCGKKAFEEGYRYFCIEFYGECWGYKEFNVTQPQKYGPKTCWGKHPNYQLCNQDQKNPVCVGTQDHGYLYEVN